MADKKFNIDGGSVAEIIIGVLIAGVLVAIFQSFFGGWIEAQADRIMGTSLEKEEE